MIYTTKKLISELQAKHQIKSKYALAKLMKVSQPTVANWIDNGITFNDKNAYRAAELLDLDYEYVLICMQIERSQANPRSARAWHKIASLWDSSKAAVFVLATLPFISYISGPAQALN